MLRGLAFRPEALCPVMRQYGYAYANGDSRYFLNSITHKRGTTTLATIGYASRDDSGNPPVGFTVTIGWVIA